ncbi:MAG TPA: SxtJ family membrane protein [Candidatus Angelobacter sp.]|nr:SxtJ family membrane protein [Candidatus Angelobacter sp.]
MRTLAFETNPSPRVLRQFSAAWLVFFLLLAASQTWRHANRTAGVVLAAIALLGIIGLIKPKTMRPLFVIASAITFPIGWVVSLVMLAIMFYGIVTPVALFMRLRGRDLLQLRKKDQESFWIARRGQPPPEQYLKQF